MCFLLAQHLIYSSFDLEKTLKQLDGLNKVQTIQDKIMQSLLTLDVTDAQTSGLGPMFLNCQTTRISKVSAYRLKAFYCIIFRHLTPMT
jgi:hypothetical protein